MKKALLFISALIVSGAAVAQTDGKNAVVNVENDYTPEVIEVTKKSFTPKDDTKLQGEPMKIVFSKSGETYDGFTSEIDIKDAMPQKEKSQPGYLRLGYGLTNDMDAKAAYRMSVGKQGALKAYAGLDGYSCKVGGLAEEWNSRLFKTTVGAGYTHRFKGLSMGIDGTFRNNVFNYQSSPGTTLPDPTQQLPPVTDKQEGQGYKVAVSGISNLSGAFSYTFDGDIEYVARRYSQGKEARIGEMRYGIGGGIGYELMTKYVSNIGANLRMDAFTYNTPLKSSGKGYGNLFSIDVDPYTMLKFGKWNLKAGVKMNFVTHGSAIFAIAPDIKVQSSIRENITLFGGITGGRTENSFAKLESITPYWGFDGSDEKLKPTYRIVDVNLGTRISFEPLSIGFSAGYAYTKDDLIQVMEQKGGFVYSNFAQDNTHHVFAALNLGYDLRGWLKLSADARYNYWDCKENTLLIMKPEVAVNLNAEARIIEDLTLRVGYNYTLYTKTDNGRMTDKHDLHARVSYRINNRFGAYIQGNNLLNCKYYEYAGYMTRGARGSLGATMNF